VQWQFKREFKVIRYLKSFTAATLLLIAAPMLAEQSGEALFKQHCQACHATQGPAQLAPPIFAVRNHYLQAGEDKHVFIEAVVAWVKQPDEQRSRMPGALARFGLMPKLVVDEQVVRQIAEYIYGDQQPLPESYKQHYRQQHGNAPRQGR